ncbi:unnamed protein product [Phyllotreta striolata]|uniref:Protein MMS22-like n=1 Tax=Phyllotreta striolata TaxID=444603 RepID=A0A9N9XKD4_PHYSR|nr:unnamed protein product [Phyllotreta striolata]
MPCKQKLLFCCEKNDQKDIRDDFEVNFIRHLPMPTAMAVNIATNRWHKEEVLEYVEELGKRIRKEWFSFQNIALNDEIPTFDMKYGRELINHSFQIIRESIQISINANKTENLKKKVKEILKCIVKTIYPVRSMRNEFVIKLTSEKYNDINNPIYQYFHTFLEIQYYVLLLYLVCDEDKSVLENMSKNLMSNLIDLSKMSYQRQTKRVFVCTCLKNSWLIIQRLFEKIEPIENAFWTLFNSIMADEDPLFSIWLLAEVASLQLFNEQWQYEGNDCSRIVPNFDLLENKVKNFLTDANSELMMQLFEYITPLLNNYWLKNGNIEVYRIMWDFYRRRMNISHKQYSNLSAVDLYDSLNNIVYFPEKCNEDFEKFTGYLLHHLNEYQNHWTKIKGRIYSQLGSQKLKELNDIGRVHVIFLFSSLSTLNCSQDVVDKILYVFRELAHEQRKSPLSWNLLTCFIFMQVNKGLSIEKPADILLSWIREACGSDNNFHLVKLFVGNFETMLNHSSNLQLHQWMFLDKWLTSYLLSCYHADMIAGVEVLLRVLERVENPDCWSLWSGRFIEFVYPVLKQLAYAYKAPSSVGKIAGKMYLMEPKMRGEILTCFTNFNLPIDICLSFLEIILADHSKRCMINFQLNTPLQILIIQLWFKFCLVSTEPCRFLTEIVTELNYFPQDLKLQLNASQDPISTLIQYLGSDLSNHRQNKNIIVLCESCFGSIVHWFDQFLKTSESDSKVSRIYFYTSSAFQHCSPLLYNRNSVSSSLTSLVNTLLLPPDVLRDKSPRKFILNCVKETWNSFYQGLAVLKDDSDAFILRVLKDLITKYMRYFSTNESPLLKALQSETIADVVLEIISNYYFIQRHQESDSDVKKVVKILCDTVQSTTSAPILKLVVTKTLYGLFEFYIHHHQGKLAVSLISAMCLSPLYPQARAEFSHCVMLAAKKELVLSAGAYFQLLHIIAKFVPGDVRNLIGKLTEQVEHAERLRGVGYDASLRKQVEILEKIVNV